MTLKSHESTLSKRKSNDSKNYRPMPLKDYHYANNGKRKVVAYLNVPTKKESMTYSVDSKQPKFFEELFQKEEINSQYELIGIYPEWYKGNKVIKPIFQVLLEDAGMEIEKYTVTSYPNPENPDRKETFTTSTFKLVGPSKYNEIWVKSTKAFTKNIDLLPVLDMLKKQNVIVRFLDIDMDTAKDTLHEIMIRINYL